MKNLLSIVLVALLSSISGFADDAPIVRLQFHETSLDDVLAFYSHLAKRKIWVALGVNATVSVVREDEIPLPEALTFIRTALLERHGIELKDSDAGETFVSWSNDPKYLHLTTPKPK
jgi:hypothetical protein